MSTLALQLIAEAKKKQSKTLDLGNCGLTELPDVLFELSQLEELILSNRYWDWKKRNWIESKNQGSPNFLSSIPELIQHLSSLKVLICGGDYRQKWLLTDFSCLEPLTQLQSLFLGYNIISDISFLKPIRQLKHLDLSSNKVSNISLLKTLEQSQSLHLSYNNIVDISSLKSLTQLQSLDIRYNKISDISFLKHLTNLRSLDLRSNNITDISFLKHLTNLQSLDLYYNMISNISSLMSLKYLKSLDLRSNSISDISSLKSLTQLQTLYLSSNNITDFSSLKPLTQLQALYLSSSNISDISFLKFLPQLQTLYLSSNNITDFSSLKYLKLLRSLNLRSNNIFDISFLKPLIQLQSLDLRSNNISDISFLKPLAQLQLLNLRSNNIFNIVVLKHLPKLQSLNLSNNKITNIEVLKNLIQLKELDLSNNYIEDIKALKSLIKKEVPVQIGFDFNSILLQGNPLSVPPVETVEQGNQAILNYFEELERGATEILETRLLIVGAGGAGKTTLRRKLIDVTAKMPEGADTTRGIEIEFLSMPGNNGDEFMLNIWDFGGQNIQHYAHQFFLTGNALYVLVHNQRIESTNFQYWLNIIEMLGKNSPILIVQNEVEGHTGSLQDQSSIIDRFQNIQQPFYQLDLSKAASDTKFADLKHKIRAVASNTDLLPLFKKKYPNSFIEVRDKLAAAAQENQYISRQDFEAYCHTTGLEKKELIADYLRTMTSLGSCLYFENDIELQNYVFLRPKWIIDALFELLYHQKIIDQKGHFSELDTAVIWAKPAYDGMQGKLIRLMENFDLCYPIVGNKKEYILPQRLPAAIQKFPWKERHFKRVIYRYKFMPKGVITRLTCRLHKHIEGEHVWSNALILNNDKARCFIRERYAENEIWIEAAGKLYSDLLNQVVDEIDRIHNESKFQSLKVQRLLPCLCTRCEQAEEAHLFDYNYLIELLEEGVYEERCKNSKRLQGIQELLQNYFEHGESNFVHHKKLQDIETLLRQEFGRSERMQKLLHKTAKDTKQLVDFYLTQTDKVHYPYVFTLGFPNKSYELHTNQSQVTTAYHLQFYCMHEASYHPVGEGYSISVKKEWLENIAPYYNQMIKSVRRLLHLGLPSTWLSIGIDDYKEIKPGLEAVRDELKLVGTIQASTPLRQYTPEEASDASMKLLKEVLQECDPQKTWHQYLKKVSNDGKVLWVCEEHQKSYR